RSAHVVTLTACGCVDAPCDHCSLHARHAVVCERLVYPLFWHYLCVVLLLMGGVWSLVCFFFFSSRRRHTRLVSDWSSDVCSSDLSLRQAVDRVDLRLTPLHRAKTGAVAEEDAAGDVGRGDPAPVAGEADAPDLVQIGRASCRERGEVWVGAVAV